MIAADPPLLECGPVVRGETESWVPTGPIGLTPLWRSQRGKRELTYSAASIRQVTQRDHKILEVAAPSTLTRPPGRITALNLPVLRE
jgi:hypothetical protein